MKVPVHFKMKGRGELNLRKKMRVDGRSVGKDGKSSAREKEVWYNQNKREKGEKQWRRFGTKS